jgi:predicted branched-subunit amino acid permease
MGAGVLSTFLIWAGPAQVLLFGSIAAGVALPAIAVAISLSSVRFLPMCMSILPILRRPGMPTWQMLVLMHYVAVTAWVEGMRRLPAMPRAVRVPFFLGFANTVMVAAALATGAGYYLIAELPPPLAAALLFTTPVFFTVSLIAGARVVIDWLALILGFAAAPFIGRLVPAGLDLLVVGVGMGSAAYLIQRILKARAGRST